MKPRHSSRTSIPRTSRRVTPQRLEKSDAQQPQNPKRKWLVISALAAPVLVLGTWLAMGSRKPLETAPQAPSAAPAIDNIKKSLAAADVFEKQGKFDQALSEYVNAKNAAYDAKPLATAAEMLLLNQYLETITRKKMNAELQQMKPKAAETVVQNRAAAVDPLEAQRQKEEQEKKAKEAAATRASADLKNLLSVNDRHGGEDPNTVPKAASPAQKTAAARTVPATATKSAQPGAPAKTGTAPAKAAPAQPAKPGAAPAQPNKSTPAKNGQKPGTPPAGNPPAPPKPLMPAPVGT